jgi:hypothetical protein
MYMSVNIDNVEQISRRSRPAAVRTGPLGVGTFGIWVRTWQIILYKKCNA